MIVRGARSENYTVLSNAILEDENLDWRDVGILIYLLSKPDHWEVSPSHLANIKKSGRDAVYASLKRLRAAGYVTYEKQSSGVGNYIVFDSPQNKKPNPDFQDVEKPHPEKPDLEKPDLENPTLVNTDNKVITDSNNNNACAREKTLIPDDFEIDPIVNARLFSSGVRHDVAKFLLREFIDKNVSTGYLSFNWPAEFASYCLRNEWRYDKHVESERRGKQGKGISSEPKQGFIDRLKRYHSSSRQGG